MKTVLILVLSADWPPYDSLMKCSQETWDSVQVDGCETVYYCDGDGSVNGNVVKLNTPRGMMNIGHKTIAAFEWALHHKQFDYIARPNSNCFVYKRGLVDHIQKLPVTDVFTTLEVPDKRENWGWGGGQAIISRDVVQLIVDNKKKWNHSDIEDMAMSRLVRRLGVPFTPAIACSIDKIPNRWRCMTYGTEAFEFDDFSEIVKAEGQFFFRTKQDKDRTKDIYIMHELFKYLK